MNGLRRTSVCAAAVSAAVLSVVSPANAAPSPVQSQPDSTQVNRDRRTTTFLRSYPNRIPLSAAVAERITRTIEQYPFDRLYDNFGTMIGPDARAAVRRSTDRYVAWVRGDFDHLT